MVQPRLGSRRRVIASSSDEDDEALRPDAKPKHGTSLSTSSNNASNASNKKGSKGLDSLPTRTRSKPLPQPPSSQATTASPTPTPNSSPEKPKIKAAKSNVPKNSTAKTLYSFFNTATQKLQQRSQIPERQQDIQEQDTTDTIEDDFSLPDLSRKEGLTQASSASTASRKRPLPPPAHQSSAKHTSTAPAPSQKYRKTLNGTRAILEITGAQDSTDADLRPWAEKYAPTNLEELVVHKKKASEVQQWLTAALAGQPYKNVLILKGPAGSGKTATLSVISKSLDFDVVEWKNPATSDFLADDYVSASAQFDDFITRGRHFNQLDMAGVDGPIITSTRSVDSKADPPAKNAQVLLVEDFPYAVLRIGPAAQSFRSSLLQCLAGKPAPGQIPTPVVLIITESVLSNNTNSTDNFTAYRLLGPDVLHHPATTVIEFNPMAPTFITKALDQAVQKHRRGTGIVLTPDPEVIRTISHIGDVRNAVATLEFLSARSDSNKSSDISLPTKGKSSTTKSKATPHRTSDILSTDPNLSLVSLRESTIGLFHAVGKVVYNKRSAPSAPHADNVSDPTASNDNQLSSHLSHHARPLVSEVSVSTLIDETGTDTSTFLSALHENYALSCASASGDSEATLDTLNACLDALSDSDILLSPVFSFSFTRGGAAEGLRQDELAFETGVRGLLHALPHPVKRQAHPGKTIGKSAGMADAHRMYYPTDLKLWRKREDILGLVDLFVGKALDGTLLSGVELQRRHSTSGTTGSVSQPGRMPPALAAQHFRGGVESWRRSAMPTSMDAAAASDETSSTYLALGSGHSARHEMLLERLPYLIPVLPSPTAVGSAPSFGPTLAKQIEQVTRFTGIGVLQDEEEYVDPSVAGDVTAGAAKGPAFSKHVPRTQKRGSEVDEEVNVRGLILSDDDIEDD